MFCNKCGSEIPDDVKFCTACGAPVETDPKEARKQEKALKKAEKKQKKAEAKAQKKQQKQQPPAQEAEGQLQEVASPEGQPQEGQQAGKKKKKSGKWKLILALIVIVAAAIACLWFFALRPFIRSFSQDNTFLYAKEDSFYYYNGRRAKEVKDEGELSELLADSLAQPEEVTKQTAYRMTPSKALSLTRFVDDPYAEEDAALTEPNLEEYKKTTTFFGYEFETYDHDAFSQAQSQYLMKEKRDIIREQIKSVTVDGVVDVAAKDTESGEETSLADAALVREIRAAGTPASDTVPVLVALDALPDGIVPMDALVDADIDAVLSQAVDAYLTNNETEAQIVLSDMLCPIHYSAGETYLVDEVNRSLYHLVRKEDGSVKLLERAALSTEETGNYKTVDDDFGNAAADTITGFVAKGRFYYTKNFDAGTRKCDLATEGRVVAEDVYAVMQYREAETDGYEEALYVKQGENALSDGAFTLSKVTGRRLKTLCEDAYAVKRLEDRSFAVLKAYRPSTGGTLVRVSAAGHEKEIDTEVSELFGATDAFTSEH